MADRNDPDDRDRPPAQEGNAVKQEQQQQLAVTQNEAQQQRDSAQLSHAAEEEDAAGNAHGAEPRPETEPEHGRYDADEYYYERPDTASSVGVPSSFSIGLSIDNDSDADSALGDVERPSSSVSATSSIYHFVEEHGRTYHRYKEGKYFMPNDIPEQERLDLQHAIATRLFGKLALAPLQNPRRVLDIGTGTGIWAVEFATAHPESDVLGTDLSPIQPDYVPPNCRFEIDDAEDEWVFSRPFDFIHARFMCGSFGDFPKVFRSCYDNLNPGGWVEFQDYYVKMQCVDNSLAGTALEKWNTMLLDGVSKMGKSGLAAAKFKSQMEGAGFVDVVEKKFALPGNPWAKGREEKVLGTMQMTNILDGLHGISISVFTKMHGWSVEKVELFLVDVRKDLKDRNIHFYYVVMSVFGRKPE
ncbi:S-adenosyl-L-methionine-dependent methyltransferase [Diplogelasinospora grovesii]|uniref:S-adenosyl-L-methionine-dependent methyltransferase n=1 Tax=Diplogelasinospora grovesii TaxID=303347 RepID=A0AAN6RZ76_9PEZI|nr:S-adenosyl-L-methionine-dependent methyltransferase [Diplogelasinospora grovesii]